MKLKTLFIVAGCVLLAASLSQAAETTAQKFPSALLPVDSFDFIEVVEGTEVVHDFIILNKGAAPLNIIRVQTT